MKDEFENKMKKTVRNSSEENYCCNSYERKKGIRNEKNCKTCKLYRKCGRNNIRLL